MIEDVSAEEIESFENDLELSLFQEYRDVISLFRYVVETDRRFYLANSIDVKPHMAEGEVYYELILQDAWVWDIYRSSRFVNNVRVITYKDINIEELAKTDLDIPGA